MRPLKNGLEKLIYITPDNVQFNMHNPPRKTVLSQTGFGLPDTNMYTNTGAYQHGESPVAFTLEPRDLSVTFRYSNTDRNEYWNAREEVNYIYRISRTNPNSPVPGKLRSIYYVDNVKHTRDIDCFLMGGLNFDSPAENQYDQFGFSVTMQFKAPNPIFYDPTPHTQALAVGVNAITYLGTWETYPSFVIAGPYLNLGLRSIVQDTRIVINNTIPGGDTVNIDLEYGSKSVMNISTGESWLGYLSLTSNLSNFGMQPHPIAGSGINYIQVSYDTGGGSISMTYYDRYISI